MIEMYFKSKRPIPVIETPPTQTSTHVFQYEKDRAAKRGLSTEEYRARCSIVMNEFRGVVLNVGDTVWPTRYPDLKKHGKCMIVGICRHYDDYGDTEWNDPPYVLSIMPLNDRGSTIQCSVGWVTKNNPQTEVC